MNKSAIERLHQDYGNKVFLLTFRLTGNRQDTGDATQEIFLRVQKGLEDFRGDSQVYIWI